MGHVMGSQVPGQDGPDVSRPSAFPSTLPFVGRQVSGVSQGSEVEARATDQKAGPVVARAQRAFWKESNRPGSQAAGPSSPVP